jgi:hypothetical protein
MRLQGNRTCWAVRLQVIFDSAYTFDLKSRARIGSSTRRSEICDSRVKMYPVHSGYPATPRHSHSSPSPVAEIRVPLYIVSRPTKGKK